MAREAHNWDDPAPLEAAPGGTAARRGAARGRSLRRARIRSMAGLRGLRRNAARASIIPTVRYRDVPAAIAWLCAAFGMERHRVVAGEGGAPCYAELNFGGSLLMIAPIEDTAFGKLMVQPDEVGGVETQVCYLFVEDAQAHYLRAKAAGAEIVLDIEEEANSGRGYSCRDPEGHVWNFGTYDPWQDRRVEPRGDGGHRGREQHGLLALLLLSLAVVLTTEAVPPPSAKARAVVAEAHAQAPPAVERDPPEAAERPAKELRERQAPSEAVQEAALQAAERSAAEARAKLAEARGAQRKAERQAAATLAQLEGARSAKEAAERAAEDTRRLLAATEKDSKEAHALASLERSRRLAAEEAAARARKRVAAFRFVRPRPRTWCYSPNVPNLASNGRARLVGFCRN
jgi:uncharacterized glyoxalase superfamily protein PhnB